jgi:hypothetical protein
MKDARQIAIDYFNAHPEAKKVAIEKGNLLLQNEWRATHHFEYDVKTKETRCWVCGQFWYGLVNRCPGFGVKDSVSVVGSLSNPIVVQNIKDVLRRETELYERTIKECSKMVLKKFKNIDEITGKEMAHLHTTYGCDPEILEDILKDEVTHEQREQYNIWMEKERSLSRASQVKEIITAV